MQNFSNTSHIKHQPSRVKRALSAHSAIGVFISSILYIICFSGTVSVFKNEIARFEQKNEPRVKSLSAKNTQIAAQNGFNEDPLTKHLYIHMPTKEYDRAIVETDNKEVYVDSFGQLFDEIAHPWSEFLIDLHYYLNLPKTFGMIIVAIFGVFLFSMSITGLLAHPRIFKDAFRFRRSKSKQLMYADLHNRLSVWTSPFYISNALSGAMIGLFTLSVMIIGPLKYNGDYQAVYAPVFGSEPIINETKAPLANIEKSLIYMADNYPNREPMYVILHDPHTEGQYLQIMAEHSERLIYAEKYNFNGNGDFLGTAGSADGAIGQQVADSVYKVHFGQFGGLFVKITYGIFGVALLFIIHAGMKIYFLKRRGKGTATPVFEGAWLGIVWGVPLLFLINFLLANLNSVSSTALQFIFWIGLIIISITCSYISVSKSNHRFKLN